MSSVQSQAPPEALGPATYTDSGSVRYGDDGAARARIGPIPPRDYRPADPDQPANVIPADGVRCPRCAHIPDAVIRPLAESLASTGKARR